MTQGNQFVGYPAAGLDHRVSGAENVPGKAYLWCEIIVISAAQVVYCRKASRSALTGKHCPGVAGARCTCVLDLSGSSCDVVDEIPSWTLDKRRRLFI